MFKFLFPFFIDIFLYFSEKIRQYFTFKSNLNIKKFTRVYFNEKLISYYTIFETNKYIHRNGYLLGAWL